MYFPSAENAIHLTWASGNILTSRWKGEALAKPQLLMVSIIGWCCQSKSQTYLLLTSNFTLITWHLSPSFQHRLDLSVWSSPTFRVLFNILEHHVLPLSSPTVSSCTRPSFSSGFHYCGPKLSLRPQQLRFTRESFKALPARAVELIPSCRYLTLNPQLELYASHLPSHLMTALVEHS